MQCWFPYNDNTPGFAISLNTMMADANWDATAARKKYCGLEAVVTTPAGKELTLYVTDAFDDTWVRALTSICPRHVCDLSSLPSAGAHAHLDRRRLQRLQQAPWVRDEQQERCHPERLVALHR